jgi:hypothetical protein
MNDSKVNRNIMIGLTVVAVIITVLIMMQSVLWGLVALAGSGITLMRGMAFLRSIEHDDRQANGYARPERHGQGQTIYVSLLDDAGVPLDEAAAAARLSKARMMAGPRDTVIGVNRQV